MAKITAKRVFIVDKSYWFVYVGATFMSVLATCPTELDLNSFRGCKGWKQQFIADSLKFLNEVSVEKNGGTQ